MLECQSLFSLHMLWLKSLRTKMGGWSGDRKEVCAVGRAQRSCEGLN